MHLQPILRYNIMHILSNIKKNKFLENPTRREAPSGVLPSDRISARVCPPASSSLVICRQKQCHGSRGTVFAWSLLSKNSATGPVALFLHENACFCTCYTFATEKSRYLSFPNRKPHEYKVQIQKMDLDPKIVRHLLMVMEIRLCKDGHNCWVEPACLLSQQCWGGGAGRDQCWWGPHLYKTPNSRWNLKMHSSTAFDLRQLGGTPVGKHKMCDLWLRPRIKSGNRGSSLLSRWCRGNSDAIRVITVLGPVPWFHFAIFQSAPAYGVLQFFRCFARS